MSEELITSYVDRTKFGSDTDFIEAELKKVTELYTKVSASKINIQGAKGLNDVVAATESGVKANARLVESVKAVNNVINQRFASEAKLVTVQTDYAKATAANRLELQKQNKELKDQAALNAANSGSIERARAQVALLNTERNKLNLFTQAGRDRQKELNEQIDKYNNFIKKNVDSLSAQKINIGNYSGAVSILKKSFDEVVLKMDKMTKEGKDQTDTFKQLEKEYTLLNKLVNTQEAGFASATAEIKANQKALIELENAGLENTKSFQELSLSTGKLQDQLSDLKATTKQLGSDTFVFDGLIGAAQGLAGAYGAAQGVAALFGDENEDLQKTFVKLQAVMTVITSLQAIQNTLQKESAAVLLLNNIRTKALAAGQVLLTFATSATTVATRAFRIALLSTGIGAILVLLTTAASAMGLFGGKIEETTLSIEEQNEALEKNRKALKEIADQAEQNRNRAANGLNDLKRELELAEARGDSEEKILAIKKEISAKELFNLRVQFETFKGDTEKQVEIAEDAKDARNKITAEELAYERKKREEAAAENKKRLDKQSEAYKKFLEDERNATFEILKLNAEERARTAENVANDETKGLNNRLNALIDYNNEKQSILNAQKDKDLEKVQVGSQQALAIVTKFGIDSNLLVEDYGKRRNEIITSAGEKDLAAFKKVFDDLTAASEKFYGIDTFKREEKKLAELLTLTQAFARGQFKTKEDFEKAKATLEKKYNKEELDAEIKHQLELATAKLISGQDATAEFTALRELKLKQAEFEIETEQDKADKIAAINAELDAKKKELATAGKDTFVALVEGQFEREKNLIEDQKKALESKTQREIELINASTLSEQDKAAKIAIINARAQAQKEQLERRQKELDVKKAQFDRLVNIAGIVGNTARGVTAALASLPPNVPLSILIGAIGAAQIAAVLARPIPRFKTGLQTDYEGLGVVGDGGKREIITRNDGTMEITPAIDTLTYLNRGDRIHSDADEFLKNLAIKDVATTAGKNVTEKSYSAVMTAALEKQTKLLNKIADKKELHLGSTERGMVALWKHGFNVTKYIDENTNY